MPAWSPSSASLLLRRYPQLRPLGGAVPLSLLEEFEGGTNGAALSPSNTIFTSTTGGALTPTFDGTDPAAGSLSMRVNVASNTSWAEISKLGQFPILYQRVVVSLDNGWPTGGSITMLTARGSVLVRAQMALNTSGQIELRDSNTTLVYTSAALPSSGLVRVEWLLDSVNALQRVQLFYGSNVNGTIPDIDSGAQTFTQGAVDMVRMGAPGNTAGTWSALFDEYAVRSDTWAGPAAGLNGTSMPATAAGSILLDAAAAASAASTASGTVTLNGSAAATVAASATGTITLGGTGTAVGAATAAGSITLGGSATATVSAAATGTITLGGTATAGSSATAAGSITLGGSGAAKANAGASGTVTLNGTAAGTAASSGAGQITLGGTATATQPGSSAAGSVTLSGTASAAAAATAAGTVTLGGTATATATASSTGAITLAGAAQLSALANAAGAITLAGLATWQQSFAGQGDAEHTLTVGPELRLLAVLRESRALAVLRETRTLPVPREDRTEPVAADSRTLTIGS